MKPCYLFVWICAVAAAAPLQAQNAPKPPRPPRAFTVYSGSAVSRSYMGIDINDVTAERVGPLKLKEERGVEILGVDQDAPAAKAGLKEHDVILSLNGTRIEGEEQLRRILRETPPGRTVTVGISRDGQPMNVQVQLGDRRKMASKEWAVPEMPPMPEIHVPEINIPAMDFNGIGRTYSVVTGMMVEGLTPQLGEFFGVKNGEGVLVRSVEKGSAAEAAGLKAGDVIVKFEGQKIADQSDWRHALRMRKSGKVNLGIVRDKREQALSLNLPEPKRPGDSSGLMFPSLDDLDEQMAEMVLAFNHNRPEIEKAVAHARSHTQRALDHSRKLWNDHRLEMEKALQDMSQALSDLEDRQ